MSGMSSGSLQPTWIGHVNTTRDALILFEACLQGLLPHVPRRPHDRERNSLIKSGYVFIFEENASGIKRWTDGVPWSPSRILGNFLVYRELMKPFPPGEKKRATKRSKALSKITRSGEPYPRQQSMESLPPSPTMGKLEGGLDNSEERALIGSLIDSYGFKEGGLVKKTISVNLHGIQHHLVSYYKVEDVKKGSLNSPATDVKLLQIEPRTELIAGQSFKSPLDALEDTLQDQMNALQQNPYGYPNDYRSGVAMAPTAYTNPLSHVDMGMYSAPTYSTTAPLQQTPYAYSPHYYPAAQNSSYSMQYSGSSATPATLHSRTSSQTQLTSYPYRQSPSLAITPRSTPVTHSAGAYTGRKAPSSTSTSSWPSGGTHGPYASPATLSTNIRSSYPSYSHTPSSAWGISPGTSSPAYSRNLDATKRDSY